MNGNERFFLQQNMNLLCRDESCSVYQMKNDTGDGTSTFYEVYPGIGVMYNDFHMESCPSRKFESSTHTFAIHHCREGRIEWEVNNGAYLYLASGDIMLDNSVTENNHCSFPVSHYHGITITISVPEAIAGISELLSMFSIDLEQLEQRFALKPAFYHARRFCFGSCDFGTFSHSRFYPAVIFEGEGTGAACHLKNNRPLRPWRGTALFL